MDRKCKATAATKLMPAEIQYPSKGRRFSMICAHLNCSEKWPFIVYRSSRIANCTNFDFGSPGGNHELSQQDPSRSQILMCPSQLQVIFKSSSHISIFISLFYLFLADPRDGYIPRRRALDAEHCKYHENNLCTLLNGMEPISWVHTFFSDFFCSKKNYRERFESP